MADADDKVYSADELVSRMAQDERTYVLDLEDIPQVLMSPRDFATSQGMSPQLVYYYIRSGKVEPLECLCGRTVLDAGAAQQALQKAKGARREGLDS